ncbi:MAG: pyruvate, phosphate dikinase, partial [Enterococcus sp.]|nr:pyruvate, phosphate dikinase [Enterococcus sp.]
DPPLHEFVEEPRALEVEIAKKEAKGKKAEKDIELLKKLDMIAEANPMLGLRGCRLSIVYPILARTQVRAIATATARLLKEGLKPKPEIMIPLVGMWQELKLMREVAQKIINEVASESNVLLEIPIGTMIELPRAALTADEIAQYADFFSFGTNDLTQTTLGFSRDDVESTFIPTYLDKKIIKVNPFATVDVGVAKLVKVGVALGKDVNQSLVCGVCGEHGGDPDSINTFAECGVDYVSCSPYRVPVARLAAAQAAINVK